MDLRLDNIINLFKQFTFIIVINTIVVQPVVPQSVAAQLDFFNNEIYELADLNGEEDSHEEEKLEDESKIEKIEFHTINFSNCDFLYNKKPVTYINPKLLWDLSLEIPIPPPERV